MQAYDINVHALAGIRSDGAADTLLDIREPDEVGICAIENSLWVPMQQVPEHVEILPREHPLIVLCHRGVCSARAMNFLRISGFDNDWNLAGGIGAWARLVEPGMPRY